MSEINFNTSHVLCSLPPHPCHSTAFPVYYDFFSWEFSSPFLHSLLLSANYSHIKNNGHVQHNHYVILILYFYSLPQQQPRPTTFPFTNISFHFLSCHRWIHHFFMMLTFNPFFVQHFIRPPTTRRDSCKLWQLNVRISDFLNSLNQQLVTCTTVRYYIDSVDNGRRRKRKVKEKWNVMKKRRMKMKMSEKWEKEC